MIRARLRALRPDLLVALGYLILPVMLYAGVTLGPRTMVPADNLFQWAPWSARAAEFGVEQPHNALIGDLIIQNYAWKRFTLESLRAGELPLWNPYLFAGAPFLANGQHSAAYPFSVLFLILPLSKAYGWFALSQVWLAGVSMYALGRILRMRRGSAALAGFAYQGAQFLIISAAVFPMIAAAVVWLPLLLGCIERVITTSAGPPEGRRRTLLWAASGAVGLGCQVLAGHAEFTYYTLLLLALYATWRLITCQGLAITGQEHRAATDSPPARPRLRFAVRSSTWLAAMVGVGLLIAAVQLVPLYEVGQVNFREGSASYDEVRGWAFPWRNALTLLLPNFYGNPAHHAYRDVFGGELVPLTTNAAGEPNPHGPTTTSWGIKNYVEGASYMGILPLLLAALGTLALRRPRALNSARRAYTLFFVALALFSVAFIFGTPLYALLYYGLPFFNQLHTPFRWVFPLALAVAALAGFGAEELFGKQNDGHEKGGGSPGSGRGERPPLIVRVLGWLAVGGGLLTVVGLLVTRLAYGQAQGLAERLFRGLAQAVDAFPTAEAFFSYQFWGVLLFGGLMAASGVVLLLSRRRGWLFAACGLIIVDLYAASAGFHAAADPAWLNYVPAAVEWLREQPGDWRLTTYDPGGAKLLNANTPWLFDLADVRGYDSIIARQYTEYMSAIEPQNGLGFNRIQPIGTPSALESPLLAVLGVRYVVSAEAIASPAYRPVWEGEGLTIYENLAVAPRAYTLPRSATAVVEAPLEALSRFDPRRFVVIAEEDRLANGAIGGEPVGGEFVAARVDSARNNEVIVSATVTEPSWLILNDSYFSGWRAYVRPVGAGEEAERETTISRANGNFRAVSLEVGDWTVRFRFSPRSFQLGGLMSFMGGIILLFALGVWAWRRVYPAAGPASTTRSVAKNSAAPMALNLFNRGIDFAFAAFYLRVLGPADAGSFATAIATAGIFEIIANYGLNILLIREVSQDKASASRFLLNSSVLRMLTAVVAAVPIAVYVGFAVRGGNPLSPAEVTAIGFMMIGMVLSGLALGVSGLFYVYEQAEIPAAMSTVTTILKVGLGVVVLLAGYSFVGLATVSILVNLVTLVALAVIAFRRFDLRGPWQLDPALLRSMSRLGFPLMLIHLLQTIFISIDVLLLRQLLPNGEEVVGWYNSAWKWFNALQVIPSFFTLALFPIISRAIKEDMDSARRMYSVSLKLMLLLALPIAVLTTFVAYPLIGVLGGPEFLPQGAVALRLIIWSIPFGWLNSVTNYVLIALGMERMQPRAFVLAVGFNVFANWLLIPRYSFVASAIITILSEVLLLVVFAFFLRRRGAAVDWVALMARPLLLAALMAGAVWLGTQLHLVVGLILGVLIYAFGLLVLGVLGPDERRALAKVAPGPLARWFGAAA